MSTNTILASAPLTSTGYHLKANGTTLGNSLIWDNGTNVGIGNTNTSYTLDVTGSGRFTTTLLVSGASTFSSAITLSTASTSYGSVFSIANTSNSKQWNFTTVGSGIAGRTGNLEINNNVADIFAITQAGNVGIGTTAPAYSLDVLSGAQYTARFNSSAAQGGFVAWAKSGTAYGYVGNAYHIVVGGTDGDMAMAATANMVFSTSGTLNERMRITSGGNVLIGSSTDGSGKLQVTGSDNTIIANWKSTSGMIQFYPYYSTYGGSIIQSITGSGASYAPLRIECTTMTVAGNQTVTGTKSFAIDHPLDNTKTLFHYSTESPKADLIYRGKANLINGKVEINIDISSKMTNGTFVALCRDIQCFTTNETGWDMVKGKVNGNILSIESNNQNSTDEISWMVIGERYDESIKNSNMLDEDGDLIVEKLKPSEPITN